MMNVWRTLKVFLFIGCFFIISCKSEKPIVLTDDGFIVHLTPSLDNGASQIQLSVVSPQIIRVIASGNQPAGNKSLMRTGDALEKVNWSHSVNDTTAILSTGVISATVSLQTGEVVFRDNKGNIILKEKEGGGKKLIPATIDAHPLYAISQVFESPEEESFYGLGQPQTGVFNYKNKDVDLTQYNSVVAVPFLLSSSKYGLLWDNYSITHFGDNREKRELGLLKPTGKNNATGLTAQYVDRYDSTKIYLHRQEDKIDYSFLPLNGIPTEFPMEKGKVIWEGNVTPDTTGAFKFFMTGSGYLKFWLDGELLLDKWREGWNPGPSYFVKQLHQNRSYSLKVEWIPESTQAFVSLKWLPPVQDYLQQTIQLSSEAATAIDYYFVYGATADDIISGYRKLTGKATLLPKWAFGFWQSRERYKTQQEMEHTVAEFRKRKIGLDNIVLDWSYWEEDKWGSFDFDKKRFPDPAGMIRAFHQQHVNIMISAWPKFYEGIESYKLFDSKNWLYKQNIKDQQRDWIGKGYVSTFYDAFNADARKGFWNLLNSKLFSIGMDGWWLDATEPDIFSNATIEKRKQLMNPTAIGPSTQYFNAYALQSAKAVYEGQRETAPDKRVFILTRSGYAGMQRYAAATWSGDIAARFDEMERQIPAGINFSMSGMPYWTSDIGGFFVEDKYDHPDPQGEALEEWRELNTRWFQFGTFSPLFRAHGQYPFREIYNVAPENHPAYKSMLFYNRLRYRLMPYIYSVAGQVYHNDYTMMRGLMMDFPSDPNVVNIGDQYMFGSSLLVNPVPAYKAIERKLYLPAGQGWYDMYSGRFTEGGQHIIAPAPYERMPLYVKEGSIIPTGPALQHTGEVSDNITLYVYTGKDASFTIYEDEGTNYHYEKGKYTTIPVTYSEASQTLTIGRREGSYDGMLENRVFKIVWITREKPVALDFSAQNHTALSYNGNEQSIVMNGKQ